MIVKTKNYSISADNFFTDKVNNLIYKGTRKIYILPANNLVSWNPENLN